jgi:hypothetical protein
VNPNNDVTPNPILTASVFMNIASSGAGYVSPTGRPIRRRPWNADEATEKAAKRAERKKERDRKRDARRRAQR